MAAPKPSRLSRSILAGAIVFATVGLLLAIGSAYPPETMSWPKFVEKTLKGTIVTSLIKSPAFWVGTVLILIMEWLWPVHTQQRLLSPALLIDFWWSILFRILSATLVGIFIVTCLRILNDNLGHLVLKAPNSIPYALRVILATLIVDFIRWFRHWLHHRVRPLWYFHAVHHAPCEITQFTGLRLHFVETMVNFAIAVLPGFLLDLNASTITWLEIVKNWHARFVHANIRTDLGWLGGLIVSPQAHRIHHSVEPRHFDVNMGTTLIIWDRLFGTYYKPAKDEYPETGINDPDYPSEVVNSAWSLGRNTFAQLWYPFRRLVDPTLGPKKSVPSEPGVVTQRAA